MEVSHSLSVFALPEWNFRLLMAPHNRYEMFIRQRIKCTIGTIISSSGIVNHKYSRIDMIIVCLFQKVERCGCHMKTPLAIAIKVEISLLDMLTSACSIYVYLSKAIAAMFEFTFSWMAERLACCRLQAVDPVNRY